MRYAHIFAALAVSAAWGATAPDVQQIVKRSVENNEASWKVAPQYAFTEHDVGAKGGNRIDRTYEVTIIEGSQYNKLVAENGKPLSPDRAAAEEQKMKQETDRRRSESPGARHKRVAAYERERHQDHALLKEMMTAFDFKLTGHENVNGRDCYVLDATPRPDYRPTSRETKVLTGMRGRMWIDSKEYQWVRVHAEVFRPVSFGLFIAHVQPGTEFTLEEAPAAGGVWLPKHFESRVKANVLAWSRNSTDDETYSNYRFNQKALRESVVSRR